MNVQGRIILDSNPFLTNYNTASRQKQAAMRQMADKVGKLKGVKVSLNKKDLAAFKSLDADINGICRETVSETARYARGEVYRIAYVAPEPYYRLGKWYEPKTLAKRSYAYTLPKNETPKNVHISKVSFINNAATGYFGEVAVIFEYGTAKISAVPMIRPAMKLAETVFQNGIKWRLNKLSVKTV